MFPAILQLAMGLCMELTTHRILLTSSPEWMQIDYYLPYRAALLNLVLGLPRESPPLVPVKRSRKW